jgi:hypothetical protein
MQGRDIQFGFERKVVEVGGFAQPFEFDLSTK